MIWADPYIVYWTQILLDSYRCVIGDELITRNESPINQSELLFRSDFIIVSHDTQANPMLNYGNQAALDLWEMDWVKFTQTPSKDTAEPVNQATRQVMMTQVLQNGFMKNYRGVRISSSGRRFEIDRAIIWNLTDLQGQACGQAATFADWQYL
jgi:MEKHLA domain